MALNGPRSLSNFTIGTFNVRGLSSATKRDQLSEEQTAHRCIQETKCPGGFDVVSGHYRLIGLPSTSRHYGLAFAVASYLEGKLLRYWSVSDRLAVLQLSLGRHSTLTVINAYGPTSQVTLHDQDTQDDFYSALDSVTTRYSSSALTLIAGDFNSKLGRKLTNERSIGEHSCGIRNTNGTALAGFLETHGLFACNTAFQHATRHKTTWQGQYRDATNGTIVPIYNTIDFVICRLSHKSLLTDSRAYAGTLLDSDHRLLIAQLDLSRLYYVWSENAQPPSAKHARYNTEQLASGPLRAQFREAVTESLPEVNPNMSASQKWDLLKGTLKSAAETTIGRSVPRHKNPHCQDMAALSETQRKLRLQINNTRNPARKQELKQQRNRILHAQRRRARDNASVRLDHLASEVERLHDGAKMFRAVQEMTRKPASKLRIQDDSGRVICNAAELNERVTHHFGQQFNDPRVMELPAFTGVPSPLTMPITPGEVQRAISKLNSGRACGHDDLPADLLKSTADLIAPAIAEIFNDALEHHESLDIGKGVLILLQKPGKPVGPLTSVRPIVLLSALRKTLSLVVLSRIATKVDNFLSPSQSGFRRGRSTADVVFGYRWLCAKAQRQRVTIEFLCIDLSRAFDTIRRDKLLEVLQSFLDEPELRMIRFLLAATSLEPRLSTGECHAFASTIGTPQGDSLSPVLFTVYLEAALRDLRSRLPPRPPADAKLPLDVEYADDIDFISYSRPYLNEIERIAPVCLGEWSLQINAAKTERTSVSRQVDRTHEPWRTTRKLGSLLGEVEDVTRRMQLANVSFHKMWTVWFRGAQISLLLRLRLYSAFVLPVLTYNMGTWGLTKTELSRLDAHHRRHLRQIIGIRWPHRISNDALYRRTHSSPISAAIRAARWSLFGHVLRLPLDAPV